MTRVIEQTKQPRIVIADDAGLIYSDDWRNGWLTGFSQIGCKVQVVDISRLRRGIMAGSSPYSVRGSTIGFGLADNIIAMKPDLVWCHHGRAASNETFLSKLRRLGIKTAVYLCDEPYETGETARYSPKFDYVFSMDFETLETHRNARPTPLRGNVFYLPPCADTSLFKLTNYEQRKVPAFFLGNPTLVPRAEWLRAVEKRVPGSDIRYWPVPGGRPIGKGHQLWISAKDHPKHYSGCVVGLNVHRHPGITKECFTTRVQNRPKSIPVPIGAQLAQKMPAVEGTGFWNDFNLPASHVNPRAFEFFACGTLCVSDGSRSELARMFPMAPQASTPDKFVELVEYYLEHRDEAEEIGRVCSTQVTRYHTYLHRAYEVLTRVGLKHLLKNVLSSSWEGREDLLTPQDFGKLRDKSLLERTGPSAQWSPQFGLSLMRTFGSPSLLNSLDAPPIVSPW